MWKDSEIKETDDLNYIYKNKLDKACFSHDAAYANSKYLAKKSVSDKILRGRVYDIALNPEIDGYQRRLATIVCMPCW